MSRKDNIIRGQKNKIEQLEEQIKTLESMLYKAQLAGIALTAGTQEMIEQTDRDRAAAQERIKALEQEKREYMRAVGE
jgi:hypothetical protein